MGSSMPSSTRTATASSSKLKYLYYFVDWEGFLSSCPSRPVRKRQLKATIITFVDSDDIQPSFDFVRSITKSSSKSSSSSVGLWLSLFFSIFLCLLAVLLSMYLAVIGVVIAALAVSHARDLSKQSSKNRSVYLLSLAIFTLCFLLLIFSAVISGLSR